MSTITKEFTKEQLQQIIETDHVQCGEASSLARIALASLEAEAVGEVVLGEYDDCGCHPDARVVCIAADGQADWENFKDGTRLYAAPPSPAEIDERDAFNAWNNDENLPIAGVGAKNAAWLAWQARAKLYAPPAPVSDEDLLHMAASAIDDLLSNKDRSGAGVWADIPAKLRRAAMLQGADGNSPAHSGCRPAQNCISPAQCGNPPAIPDGWVACSEQMPEQFKAILAFNEYGEVWSGAYDRYWNFYCDNLLVEHVTHWMPLPAAPQQEVK